MLRLLVMDISGKALTQTFQLVFVGYKKCKLGFSLFFWIPLKWSPEFLSSFLLTSNFMSWRVPIYVLGGNNFSWECFSPFTEEKLSRDGLDQIMQIICDEKHKLLELKTYLTLSQWKDWST